MKTNKKIFIPVFAVALLVVATLGATYAFFNYTRTGTNNTITTGTINFNSTQSGTFNLTDVFPIASSSVGTDGNSGIVTINITGDTTYSGGIEYLVTTTDVNASFTRMINEEEVEMPVPLTFKVEADGSAAPGTQNDNYFSVRGGDTSYYKVLASNVLTDNQRLLVGYIAPGPTGVNGNLKITAYIDKDLVAISDTYNNNTNRGSESNTWARTRTVLTTSEWNSLNENGISFKVKVEANEGLWVGGITYNLNGGLGTTPAPVEINASGTSVTLANPNPLPTKTGYTFAGWNTQADGTGTHYTAGDTITPTEPLSLYTEWSKDTYTITYNLDGGENNENNPSTYSVDTETITLQNPTKLGYTFIGWTGEGIDTPTKNLTISTGSTNNKTYTANYTKDVYTITYNLDGGTNNSNNPSTYSVDTPTITLADVTKTGYTFTGWTGEGVDTPTKNLTIQVGSTNNKTYTANFTKDVYTITYNLDGGTNNSNNPSTYSVDTATITLADPTKTDFNFAGWTTEGVTTPTKNLTIPMGSTGNKTFTANWYVNAATYISSKLTDTTPYGKVYTGANPDNYVWFNNEQWRIIGVYGNRIKIIKATPLEGEYPYDISRTRNPWSGSTMQTYLSNNYTTIINDATSRGMIDENATWNVGAASLNDNASAAYSNATKTPWTGKIGLIATYEYQYAAESSCWNTSGLNYKEGCGAKDWLLSTVGKNGNAWTSSPSSGLSDEALLVGRDFDGYSDGYVTYYMVGYSLAASPVVYLKSTINITGGNGQAGQANYYKLG